MDKLAEKESFHHICNCYKKDFLEESTTDHKGIYRLTYHVASYFERLQQDSFYPFIEVVFEIKDGKHYRVPITLSPYGYSTYRGN